MAEQELVEILTRGFNPSSNIIAPVGTDDCSVMCVEDTAYLQYRTVVESGSTSDLSEILDTISDTVVELTEEFDPIGLVVFLGVPRESTEVREIVLAYRQEVQDVCDSFGIDLLAGDINETGDLILATTAVGAANSSDIASDKVGSHVLDIRDHNLVLHSIDAINATLAASTHIPDIDTARGYYVFDANMSDIICSGGKPAGIQLFSGLDDKHMKRIWKAIDQRRQGQDIQGLGDTRTEKRIESLLGATVVGVADDLEQLTLRDGASPDDLIAVTGPLGIFTAATYALEKGVSVNEGIKSTLLNHIVDTGLPLEETATVRQHRIGRGGIDISDGFSFDLSKLMKASDINGARIFADHIPITPEVNSVAEQTGHNPLSFTWSLGGDWESIITISKDDWDRLMANNEAKGDLHVVGELTNERQGLYLQKTEQEKTTIEMPVMGYQAFDYRNEADRDIENFEFSDRIEADIETLDRYFNKLQS
jgi:thiamine-monophosphate kinase